MLYNEYIDYLKSTDINVRVNNRRFQSSLDYLYTENHHIVPKHDGGTNSDDNMIIVLPEEHIILHQKRWLEFKQRGDMLAVRFCVNGFKNKKFKEMYKVKEEISEELSEAVAWIKQNSAEVRKTHGWQSEDGRRRISESMKNKLVVRDKISGELMGKHDKSHPKIQDGSWVHHSYKRQKTEREIEMLKIRYASSNNPNYSGITDNEIIEYAMKHSILENRILPYGTIKHMARSEGKMFPLSLSKMRFNGEKTTGYVKVMKRCLPHLEYNKAFKTSKMKENARKARLKYLKENK